MDMINIEHRYVKTNIKLLALTRIKKTCAKFQRGSINPIKMGVAYKQKIYLQSFV